MARAKPVRTTHRAAGFIAAYKVKEPRVVWRELEARGVKGVRHAQLAVGDAIVAFVGKTGDVRLVHAASEVHESDLAHGTWEHLALRDDGGAALVADARDIAEVELPSGRARALAHRIEGKLAGVAYAHDEIAILVDAADGWALHVMRRSGDALESIASRAIDDFIFGFGGRAGVLVATTDDKETSTVLVWKNGRLDEVGKLKPRLNMAFTCGDELHASGQQGTYAIDLADASR
jgi:hypothetical protein